MRSAWSDLLHELRPYPTIVHTLLDYHRVLFIGNSCFLNSNPSHRCLQLYDLIRVDTSLVTDPRTALGRDGCLPAVVPAGDEGGSQPSADASARAT